MLLTVPHILWRNAIITEWVQKSISRKQKEWYQKAAEAGDKNAREQLELLF